MQPTVERSDQGAVGAVCDEFAEFGVDYGAHVGVQRLLRGGQTGWRQQRKSHRVSPHTIALI
jgi:hypothetical protein